MAATTEYVTVDAAIDKLGDQLYRILDVPEGSDITANASLLSALESANLRIDSALRGRYALPLEPVPGELTQPGVDLARYYLLGILQQAVSPDDRLRYEDAENYLRRIGRGEDRLDIIGVEEVPAHSVTAIAGRTGVQVVRAPGTEGQNGEIGYFAGLQTWDSPSRRCP